MSVTMDQSPRTNTIQAAVLSDAELRSIAPPTLLLIGSLERRYEPHATLQQAKVKMPRLDTAIVPDGDHLAAMSQPERVNALILAFPAPP